MEIKLASKQTDRSFNNAISYKYFPEYIITLIKLHNYVVRVIIWSLKLYT